jgi:Putative MetA-pathway of phenol degradation
MRLGRASGWWALRWVMPTLALGLFELLGLPTSGEAQALRNTVRDLYPNGIQLEPTGHQAHFTATSFQGLDSLNSAIADNVGLFAFNSAVSGFTFDIERGVPVRTTESFGPLLAERAPTLGAGKLNVGFSYTRIDFSRFEGQPLSDLSLTFHHQPTCLPVPCDFEADAIRVRLNLKISEDVFGLFATYGLTQNWDAGVIVPIVHIKIRANAHAEIVRNSPSSTSVHNFGPDSTPPDASGGGEDTGLGDVILRTKYNFFRNDPTWPDLAVVGELKLPTGDADNLLGTGETNLKALLVASKTYDRWTPHVNVGFEWSTEGTSDYNFRYVLGADVRVLPSLTAVVDFLGRSKPAGTGIGDHILDGAFGLKWNPWRSLILSGGVQVPLNRDEGLRADVIWGVGAEYTF